MEGVWQAIQDFATRFYDGAKAALDASQPWQILLVIGALLIMVLLLAIGLKVANRAGDAAADALEENAQQLQKAQAQVSEVQEQAVKAQTEKEEALRNIESAKNNQLMENASQLALARTRIEQLEQLRSDETAFMSGARIEAARIVRDAKDYAFTVASRADTEYAEMMHHANEEAESLRALSQQRLDQAHETLKKALNRASEIITEAHAEAARAGRVLYEAPPGRLIEAEALRPAPLNASAADANDTDSPEN